MKYPKTLHFPFSPGVQNDDRMMINDHHFIGSMVTVSEKIDGENTSLHSNRMHARSEDSLHHESRNYTKAKWGSIKHLIPDYLQVIVENVYAKHSIYYDCLTDFQYMIGVIDKKRNIFLSYDETVLWSEELTIPMVPLFYKGLYNDFSFEKHINGSFFGNELEGYVVRKVDEFPVDEFQMNVGKWVRKGHVQTGEHWLRTWYPNKLKEK